MNNDTPSSPSGGRPDGSSGRGLWRDIRDSLLRRVTHEQLAYLFVLSLYVAGMLLTALLIVQALTWGLLSSFGRLRMTGLVVSFASAGLVVSRIAAGRYGNRLAAHYLPRTLSHAVGARSLMGDFGLASARELTAFVVLYKLHVYSTRTALFPDGRGETNEAGALPCVLEPLFTHDMYLPMMRSYLIRARRLWFDADEVDALIRAEGTRFDALRQNVSSRDDGRTAELRPAP